MQEIKINRPEIFQKLRSRLGVRTGLGRSADLELSIQPTIDIDPLLLLSRAHHVPVTVGSVTSATVHTVPAGEFWHMKSVSFESVAGADYSLLMTTTHPAADDPAATLTVPLTELWTFSGIGLRLQVLGMTIRPGDKLGWESLVWVADGGAGLMNIAYDLEDCAS